MDVSQNKLSNNSINTQVATSPQKEPQREIEELKRLNKLLESKINALIEENQKLKEKTEEVLKQEEMEALYNKTKLESNLSKLGILNPHSSIGFSDRKESEKSVDSKSFTKEDIQKAEKGRSEKLNQTYGNTRKTSQFPPTDTSLNEVI